MTPTSQGSFRLFQVAGIQVFVHWSWLLIAFYQIEQRRGAYSSIAWNVAEYLSLFLIVLLHEFGHAFATRQVGGRADQIVLWPFGGVAYVQPPPRPGAELWSIAAGPLVNVALFIPLTLVFFLEPIRNLAFTNPDAYRLLNNLWYINGLLFVFNMLPIYPLDGGQILRSLLWFPLGQYRSLYWASIVGFVGVAGLAALAILQWNIWLGIIAFLVFASCREGLMQARAAGARAKAGAADPR